MGLITSPPSSSEQRLVNQMLPDAPLVSSIEFHIFPSHASRAEHAMAV